MSTIKKYLYIGLIVVSIYSVYGYQWGRSDQAEIIALAQAEDDTSIFTDDFYVSHMISRPLHERTAITMMIHTVYQYPFLAFILHLLFTVFLVTGLFELTKKIVPRDISSFLVLWLLFIIFSQFSLGDNELYYNFLIGSLVAKTLAVWSLVFLYREKWWISIVLLGIASWFQLVVGLQVTLIIGFWLCSLILKKRKFIWQLWIGLVAVIASIVPLIQSTDGHISTTTFFEITEFRNAHHYFPSYFHWVDWVVMTVLVLFIAYFLLRWGIDHFLKMALLAIFLGIVVYVVNIRAEASQLILSSQWFKTTIWVEWLGIATAIFIIESFFQSFFYQFSKNTILWTVMGITLLLAVFRFDHNHFDFFKTEIDTEELLMGVRLQDKEIDKIIVPPSFVTYKPIAQKSSPVEYKSYVHEKDEMLVWYNLVHNYFGLDITNRRRADNFDEIYAKYLQSNLEIFQEDKIDCIVIPREYLQKKNYEILSETTDFVAIRP